MDNTTSYQTFIKIRSQTETNHHPDCREGKTGAAFLNDDCGCAEYFWYVAGVSSAQETKQEEKPLLIYTFPDPFGTLRTEVGREIAVFGETTIIALHDIKGEPKTDQFVTLSNGFSTLKYTDENIKKEFSRPLLKAKLVSLKLISEDDYFIEAVIQEFLEGRLDEYRKD